MHLLKNCLKEEMIKWQGQNERKMAEYKVRVVKGINTQIWNYKTTQSRLFEKYMEKNKDNGLKANKRRCMRPVSH